MKVAVITPYYKEPLDILEKCHESVLKQTYSSLHVMVADGYPIDVINQWKCDHVILPRGHNDIGSTPRLIGSYHAIGLGYDAIAFLDADNWYREDHIESLVQLQKETGASFLSSGRMLCRLDGSEMGLSPQINNSNFVDTNCMMFTRKAFHLLDQWVLMPEYGHLIGDRIISYHISNSKLSMESSRKPSVYYRCSKAGIYYYFGEEIPEGVLPRPDYESSFKKWVEDGNPPLI